MVNIRTRTMIREYVVNEWLNGDGRGLSDETDLQEAGLLDSLSTLSLISFLESSFEIRLDPADVNPETFRSLDTVAALVDRKAGGADT